MTQISKLALAGCLTFWAAGIVFGTRYANDYSSTAGKTVMPLDRWPANSGLSVSRSVPTLVIAIHPKCPCSESSVEELRIAIERSGTHPKVYALVLQPSGAPPDWLETSVIRGLREIPAVHMVDDLSGAEIAKFHARVSGEVFLYDTSGKLSFHGGLTASRGHAGANTGRDAVIAILRHEEAPLAQTPVFGCSLRDEGGTEPRRQR